ncbi:MAG: DUF1700 domain-containing protein [Erysipelotrichaceae bacterium]
MKKDEFLSILNHRLQVIDDKERKDIIDEYENHIDMRIHEGKSEEEAIADFGDLDELIDDILAAYKIDSKKVNQNNDQKINDFLDRLFNSFQRFIGSFTSLNGDAILHLMFEFIVVLILLWVLKIFFWVVGDIGSSILRSIAGYGIGNLFGGLWDGIIHLGYLVLFLVILFNVFVKRIKHYQALGKGEKRSESIMDDFKESFRFDQVKENMNAFQKNDNKSDSFTSSPLHSNGSHPYDESNDTSKTINKNDSYGNSIKTILMMCLKVFVIIMMIPLISMQFGFFILLAIMIGFSVQGFSLLGAYLILIGLIIGVGALLSLIYRCMFKGGVNA